MYAATKPNRMQFWLEYVSSQSSVDTALGAAVWFDGRSLLNEISLSTFFKPVASVTPVEDKGLQFLDSIIGKWAESPKDFNVVGDLTLRWASPLYDFIQRKAIASQIKYSFENDLEGDFIPWGNKVSLGTKFYRREGGRTNIPFYSLNHENAHLTLFKEFYSNIDVSDVELARLYLLIEWFCVSTDLILAFDLHRSGMTACLNELNKIPNKYSSSVNSVFWTECQSIDKLNSFAGEFRKSIVDLEINDRVEGLMSLATIRKHVSYSNEILVGRCRAVPSKTSIVNAKNLLQILSDCPFTEAVNKITGLVYA